LGLGAYRPGLDLTRHLFAPVDEPGTRRGNVWRDIELDTGLTSDPEVISVASHDTASAVAAMAMDDNTMFISSGTWSLAGTEVDEPIISDEARLANFTNEAGIRNTTRFLRNATGFWLLQECRRIWNTRGYPYDYDELIALARTAPPLRSMIDPDHPDFLLPDDMPAAILDFCGRTGQPQPDDHGAVIRVALESMALNYRHILTDVERLSGRHITRIHIAGGGSKNPLHCQFTADATGRMVVAGPSEATALGNVMVQARSLNLVDSLEDIREVIERSFETPIYEPRADRDQWDEAYQRYVELKSMSQI
jgi:rhamnulokinase